MHLSVFFCFIFTLLILCTYICEGLDCSGPPKTITVSQSSQANFRTIQSAVDSIPKNNFQWIHIQISSGIYREQVSITPLKTCIYLEGAGMKYTSIEWNNHMLQNNATFNSRAHNIVAKGITFKNTYNDPIMMDKNNIEPAEAARVEGDKCAFFGCAFLGVQDTLYDHSGRHYFHRCYFQGGVDFIYGDGQSIYEESIINFSMGKNSPPGGGYITAQQRESATSTSGFVFKNCTITGRGKGLAYLGRGYRPYARVIIANSFLSDVVKPEGWDAWTGAGHEGNLTYVEEGCRGPGADKSKRVPWMKHLSGSELDQFLNIAFIDQERWIAKLPI